MFPVNHRKGISGFGAFRIQIVLLLLLLLPWCIQMAASFSNTLLKGIAARSLGRPVRSSTFNFYACLIVTNFFFWHIFIWIVESFMLYLTLLHGSRLFCLYFLFYHPMSSILVVQIDGLRCPGTKLEFSFHEAVLNSWS